MYQLFRFSILYFIYWDLKDNSSVKQVNLQVSCVHPLKRHLPQRHQAPGNLAIMAFQGKNLWAFLFQNLLLDPESGILKLCDFGSAKHLVRGEPNVSYICSRYYRSSRNTPGCFLQLSYISSGHLNWFLGQRTTQRTLMCGVPVAFLLSWCWARLVWMEMQSKSMDVGDSS